jgi:TetR/AcrR family transcriptional regulator, transcriptional repressor for nem operon
MARPRSFDSQAVNERIADVFTAHGYQGTSVAMLAEAAGLGKQSLYNSFGDKHALYLQAVDCATDRRRELAWVMTKAENGRAAVEAFFDAVMKSCASADPAQQACIVSAGLLEDIDDEVIAAKLREKWRESRTMLQAAVQRGQQDGSIRGDASAADLANLLMTLMSGLRVTARAVDGPRPLKAAIGLVLKVLEPAGTG